MNFVPNWVAQGKKEGVYRFLAIRERFEQAPLPAMEMGSRGWYKVFGLVTNRELPGEDVIESLPSCPSSPIDLLPLSRGFGGGSG